MQKIERDAKQELRGNIDVDKYEAVTQLHGVGRAAERAMRNLGCILPPERAITKVREEIDSGAQRMFGDIVEYTKTSAYGAGISPRSALEGLARAEMRPGTEAYETLTRAALDIQLSKRKGVIADQIAVVSAEMVAIEGLSTPQQQNKRVKLESMSVNVDRSKEAALRNGVYGNRILPEIKEEAMGVSIVRAQAAKQYSRPKLKTKWSMDGAVVTRQVINEHSKHWCAMVEVLNTQGKNNSANNTYCYASVEGGDAEGREVLDETCATIEDLRENGLKVKDVLFTLPSGEDVIIPEVHFEVECVLAVDGALLFHFCDGPCSGSAKEPCPFCHDVKDRHSKKCSMGFYAQMVKITDLDQKLSEICDRYYMKLEQLIATAGSTVKVFTTCPCKS